MERSIGRKRIFWLFTLFLIVVTGTPALSETPRCTFCAGVSSDEGSMPSTETAASMKNPMGPAQGYDLHVQAPHLMANGEIGGPFHHFCKGISGTVFQCLLFETTDANAPLVAVEYFVAKTASRKLPLIQWHRYFHDHQEEIDTGRLFILDVDDENKKKEIAEAAGKTDGVIYHLWQKGQEFPDGTVTFPQSIGVQFPQPN
ncbi:MAG: OBAP family protein [Nitrospirota bacterium]|nr:OBAP family protein [Nitrospirota bacterium]